MDDTSRLFITHAFTPVKRSEMMEIHHGRFNSMGETREYVDRTSLPAQNITHASAHFFVYENLQKNLQIIGIASRVRNSRVVVSPFRTLSLAYLTGVR